MLFTGGSINKRETVAIGGNSVLEELYAVVICPDKADDRADTAQEGAEQCDEKLSYALAGVSEVEAVHTEYAEEEGQQCCCDTALEVILCGCVASVIIIVVVIIIVLGGGVAVVCGLLLLILLCVVRRLIAVGILCICLLLCIAVGILFVILLCVGIIVLVEVAHVGFSFPRSVFQLEAVGVDVDPVFKNLYTFGNAPDHHDNGAYAAGERSAEQ